MGRRLLFGINILSNPKTETLNIGGYISQYETVSTFAISFPMLNLITCIVIILRYRQNLLDWHSFAEMLFDIKKLKQT